MMNETFKSDTKSQGRESVEKYLPKSTSRLTSFLRWSVLIAAVLLLNFLLGKGFTELIEGQLDAGLSSGVWVGVAALVVYALLLAIPFVPGVEIGIALLIMQGSVIAPFVHAATVAGLLISFAIGWAFATTLPCKFLDTMGLHRACAFVDAMKVMSRQERLEYLNAAVPRWIGRWILRYRYVLLAVLINLPGNSLIGGGGGILLVAGLSRLFSLPFILVTVILATAPVPLALWLIGVDILK